MKILHSSDWHVGKQIRGASRADEHRQVLAEIVDIAANEAVDLILVAGDLFDSAAPGPESERIVYQGLLALGNVAPVVAIAGNHDNPRRLEAVAPLLVANRVQVIHTPLAPADGGVVKVGQVDIAVVPFVSQRSIVKAKDLMSEQAFTNTQAYRERMRQVIAVLSEGFSPDRVNIVMAHAYVLGAETGGGERPAHLVEEYVLNAQDFPTTANYVALGHLHRPQKIPGPATIYYAGSPLQLDFGEVEQQKSVCVVELEPALPAKVTQVELKAGKRLITLTGSLEELQNLVTAEPERIEHSWVQVKLTESTRSGLAESAREIIGPSLVDVRVVSSGEKKVTRQRALHSRTPVELFGDYLEHLAVTDPALQQAFSGLYEELSAVE